MSSAFSKRRSGPVLSRDEAQRQGQAVRSAAAALPDMDSVRLFLNSPHEGLGGRPIDLALASAAGLEAVETAISAEAGRGA